MKKTCVLSHAADLDGCVAALNTYHALKNKPNLYEINSEDVYFADYADSEAKLLELVSKYECLFITDLSWKSTSLLDKLPKDEKFFVFLDHHKDSKAVFDAFRSDFPNVWAELSDDDSKCAADMAFELFDSKWSEEINKFVPNKMQPYMSENDWIKECLRTLTRYTHSRDLWIRDEPMGELLTEVIAVKDVPFLFNYFVDYFDNAFGPGYDYNGEVLFSESYDFYTPKEFKCYHDECERTNEISYAMAGRTRLSGELKLPGDTSVWLHSMYSFGPISEIGATVVEQYKLGWAVMVNLERGSLSIRSNKETFELLGIGANDIAKMYGGGGHTLAAGAPLEIDDMRNINSIHNEIMTVLIKAIPQQLQNKGLLKGVE